MSIEDKKILISLHFIIFVVLLFIVVFVVGMFINIFIWQILYVCCRLYLYICVSKIEIEIEKN